MVPRDSPTPPGSFDEEELPTSRASIPPLEIPEMPEFIGSYRILQEIGRGGMGVVYLARQSTPVRRDVAIKVIRLGMDTKGVVARFEAERQALAIMDHPNIATVFDAGTTEDGRPFFVMEHVPGVPITEYCDQHRLDTRDRLQLFAVVCEAIHHAHQKGIIHRDVKPSNVLVAVKGSRPFPKVIDFGVAKAIDRGLTELTYFTELGQLIGTPTYMSPEQAEFSSANIDTTTDVYSLGVLLYELLVGVTPFDAAELRAKGLQAIHELIREVEPRKPSTRVSTLGDDASRCALRRRTQPHVLQKILRGELDWITMKALEKDRTRRYASASEFAADVQRFLDDEPVLAGAPSAAYRLRKFAMRHRTAVAGATAVVAALLLGLAGTAWQAVRAGRAETGALSEAAVSRAVNAFLTNMLADANPVNQPRAREMTLPEVLDAASDRVAHVEEPTVQAALHNTIGTTYRSLGLYDKAEEHLRAGAAATRTLAGETHPDYGHALNQLGRLELGRGKLDAAESLFVRARDILELTHDPSLAFVENNLGSVYLDRGDPETARRFLTRALELHRELGGTEMDIAQSLSNLGGAFADLDEPEEAIRLYREAFELGKNAGGDDHPQVNMTRNNLALALKRADRLDEAEPLYREGLEIARRTLGDAHPDVALLYNNLAALLTRQGRDGEAVKMLEESLRIWRGAVSGDHVQIATVLNNLGQARASLYDFDTAESLLRESTAMRRRLYGEQHVKVTFPLNGLASIAQKRGRYDEAVRIYRDVLSIRLDAYGPDHPKVATAESNLALALCRIGGVEEAERLSRRALEIRRAAYGEEHSRVVSSMRSLGLVLLSAEKNEESATTYRESVALAKKVSGERHSSVGAGLEGLGRALTKLGRFAEAEPVLREAADIRGELYSDDDWKSHTSRFALGLCLAGMERGAEAESLLVPSYSAIRAAAGVPQELLDRTRTEVMAFFEAAGLPERAAGHR